MRSRFFLFGLIVLHALGLGAIADIFGLCTTAFAQTGAAISSDTQAGYRKSNQSKVFHHDGAWWAVAYDGAEGRWYLWKFLGSSWSKATALSLGLDNYWDLVLNSASTKLYAFASRKTAPEFWRFTYADGAWTIDAGFPVVVSGFTNGDLNNPVSLVRAKNGDLWIFRIVNNVLQAKRSTNEGQTWSANIAVKSGLTTKNGMTDAVTFSSSGNDYVGVAYGETNIAGNHYGFLKHRDGDPNATWTDETAMLTFFGNERALNAICTASDANNNVYLFTRNANTSGGNPRNTLYKRNSAGTWKKFKLNSTASAAWKTPALAIDEANDKIYVMGVNLTTLQAEYKTCAIGAENTLNAALPETLMANTGASFDNLSVPVNNFNDDSGLMVCGDNLTANEVWFRRLATGLALPLVLENVLVAPNQVSAPASYTIAMTLGKNGALAAGGDQLSFRFPAGTSVPNSMNAAQITIDGVAAANVVSNETTREVSLSVPIAMPDQHHFLVVFNTGAGLLNPAGLGSYALEAWTSAQPAPVLSPSYALEAGNGAAISTATKSELRKSNQSKVFYHDNQWWALAVYDVENRWYIWKYNGDTWTRTRSLEKGAAYHWDAVINNGLGKLYLFGSNKTAPEFRRYSYASGTWNKDAGFPVAHADFRVEEETNPVSLAQAKNGDLWIFRVSHDSLQAKRSANEGANWSAIIPLKTGLNTPTATTDAASFKSGGNDYLGVAYAEHGALTSRYGFLLHLDGAAESAWTDESSALTFFGSESAHNGICLAVSSANAANNNVYLFTQNAAGGDPHNTLYRRGSTGMWKKFKVNAAGATAWKSPALALDRSNNVLYAMGVNTNTLAAEYKICLVGEEADLETTGAVALLSGSAFDNLSVPANNVEAVTGLMVSGDNVTTNDIWYRRLAIIGTLPVAVGAITVSPPEVNTNAAYTIPRKLSIDGGLGAHSGVISVSFPHNTIVPNTMPAGSVLVDGTPATAIIASSATRQVSLTTPVSLPKNHAFNLVFNLNAGVFNPTKVDSNYKLTVWTSAQPTQAQSPPYHLTQATTTVSAATVAPFPTNPDSLANYTISFNLGPHGRLLADTSAILVKFNAATRVTHGAISGAKVNLLDAVAHADSAQRLVTITAPAGVALNNSAAVTVYLPTSAVRNPAVQGNYALMIATSVETTLVASNLYAIAPENNIGAPIANTSAAFDRNNQSKMFYHDGKWWLTAQAKHDRKWYLWKFDGTFWTQDILLHNSDKRRPDCVLDAANNRAYILLPGASETYLTRLKYASGTWAIDAGYPYTLSELTQDGERGLNLVRAQNGQLWVFGISDSTLVAKRSGDNGQTWSAIITIKDSLHNWSGLTDAVTFSFNGANCIGLGYAEKPVTPGSIYGFLRHKLSDPDSVWIDETAALPQFVGMTSDDHLSMAAHNNEVFIIVNTHLAGPATVNTGLLHRATNGAWTQYPILYNVGWTKPALAIDADNNRLYVMGTREQPVRIGEMKNVTLGAYASLISAPIDTIFMNEANEFFDISVAAHAVNGAMGLLVCNGNVTRDELWFHHLTLGGVPKLHGEAALRVVEAESEGVQAFPNPFNPHTFFRFRVKERAEVKLQIFNLSGQLVRTLAEGSFAAGVYNKRWNGRNEQGVPAASGVYFYRLQIGPQTWRGKIQMLK